MPDERVEFDARLFEAVGGKDIRDFLRVQKYAYELACAYVNARREFNSDRVIVSSIKQKCQDRYARQNRAKILAIASDMLLPSYLKQHDLAWFEEALGVAAPPPQPYSDEDLMADHAAFREFMNEVRSTTNSDYSDLHKVLNHL
jgi:hypothetical protein